MPKTKQIQGALHIIELPEEPAVRVQVMLDGEGGDWVNFDTHDNAWGLIDTLTKHVEAVFGPR
jgi:hypothetical protein